MGLEFRFGSYYRRVWVGKRTIKEGEGCIIWSRTGKAREVVGPKLVYMCFSSIRFMNRMVADDSQYLLIKFRDGRKETICGPIAMFQSHIIHESIEVLDAVALASKSHALVVRSQACNQVVDDKDERLPPLVSSSSVEGKLVQTSAVSQNKHQKENQHGYRIVVGPTVFVPLGMESIVEHSWSKDLEAAQSGVNTDARVLFTGPQIVKSPVEFRTLDGARCTMYIAVKIGISSLEQLVENSSDPISEIFNALYADVHELVTSHELTSAMLLDHGEQVRFFKEVENHFRKSSCETVKAGNRLGIVTSSISVVDFHGLEEEYKAQLKSRIKKQNIRDELAQKEQLVDAEAKVQSLKLERQIELDLRRTSHEISLQKKWNKERIAYFTELSKLKVDLTKILQGRNQLMPKPGEIIEETHQSDAITNPK